MSKSIAKANDLYLKSVKFPEDSPDCYRPAFICDGSVDCVDTGKDELDCDTRKILKFEISDLNPGTIYNVICQDYVVIKHSLFLMINDRNRKIV